MELLKFCNNCKTHKTRDDFNKMTRAKDGLQSKCKFCFHTIRNKNKEKIKDYNSKYRIDNREKMLSQQRQYKEKNKEVICIKNKLYTKNNRIRINEYIKNRMCNDIEFRLKNNFRSYIKANLKNSKRKSSLQYVNYSIEDLRIHLESKFKDGMTWENHGIYGWHIDHIKPLCLFDMTKEEEIKKAWALDNLQPLWAKENLTKNKKYQPWN